MSKARLPYWLAGEDRNALAGACRAALHGDAAGTHDAAALQDVLTELGVATARDSAWPASAPLLRRAAGWADDVVPIRMSTDEIAAVLRHTPDGPLRAALVSGRPNSAPTP